MKDPLRILLARVPDICIQQLAEKFSLLAGYAGCSCGSAGHRLKKTHTVLLPSSNLVSYQKYMEVCFVFTILPSYTTCFQKHLQNPTISPNFSLFFRGREARS